MSDDKLIKEIYAKSVVPTIGMICIGLLLALIMIKVHSYAVIKVKLKYGYQLETVKPVGQK